MLQHSQLVTHIASQNQNHYTHHYFLCVCRPTPRFCFKTESSLSHYQASPCIANDWDLIVTWREPLWNYEGAMCEHWPWCIRNHKHAKIFGSDKAGQPKLSQNRRMDWLWEHQSWIQYWDSPTVKVKNLKQWDGVRNKVVCIIFTACIKPPIHCHRDNQFYRGYRSFRPRLELSDEVRIYLYIVVTIDPNLYI